jgi:hypothetical protein
VDKLISWEGFKHYGKFLCAGGLSAFIAAVTILGGQVVEPPSEFASFCTEKISNLWPRKARSKQFNYQRILIFGVICVVFRTKNKVLGLENMFLDFESDHISRHQNRDLAWQRFRNTIVHHPI